jgi:hypothetical protein
MFQFQRFISQDFYLSMMRSDGNASYGSLPSIRNMLEQQINEYNTALAEYNNINNDVTSKKLLKSGDGLLKAYDDYFRENPTADRTEFDNFKLGFEPWKQAYQPPTTAMPTTPNETYVDMNDPRFQRQMEQAAAEAVGSGNYGATPADIGNLGNGAPAGGTAPTATTEATVDNRPRSDTPYDPAPNIDSEGNPYTPIAEGPQTTPKAPARNELTKSEEKEIEQNIKSLYAANPDNKVGFFTRNFSDFSNGTTEKATERLQKAYKEVDEATINKMKIANVNFPKQAAEAALAGDNRLDTFIKKEQSKLDFVQDYINALDKPINKNQAKELANAADRFIDPKQKGDVAVDTKGVIKFVKKFQEQNKDDKGKQLDFPINLVTDRKNAPMLQLAAKNPELAATAIEAFKAQGKSKGLTAYKAVDLGTGIEIAMGAANKQADPESKKLAAKNVANLVMNDAASIGFFTGKAKLDDKKIKAIEKGLKSEPKPLKSVPDTKEGRLTQAASNAAKYPKVYAALTAAMSKDGKTKVTNRDLNKAFENLGVNANALENSTLSKEDISKALNEKVSLSAESKNTTTVADNLRDGRALTSKLTDLINTAKLNQDPVKILLSENNPAMRAEMDKIHKQIGEKENNIRNKENELTTSGNPTALNDSINAMKNDLKEYKEKSLEQAKDKAMDILIDSSRVMHGPQTKDGPSIKDADVPLTIKLARKEAEAAVPGLRETGSPQQVSLTTSTRPDSARAATAAQSHRGSMSL